MRVMVKGINFRQAKKSNNKVLRSINPPLNYTDTDVLRLRAFERVKKEREQEKRQEESSKPENPPQGE